MAKVQYVLIFGSDLWVINPRIMRALGIPNKQVEQRIYGRMPWYLNGKWEYPPIGEALTEVGLGTIGEYITCSHNIVAQYIDM